MAIFGWLMLVVISCYATFYFIAGSIVSMGFSGKSMGLTTNILGGAVIIGLWYFTAIQFPFEVSIK
ncbi:TMhelix containing protein [Vibrio phage 1.248.O._10N.261.54.F1]|nr:TMhelix containing protein [Vibrio phage 1.248.O._10N.261.54.F1]